MRMTEELSREDDNVGFPLSEVRLGEVRVRDEAYSPDEEARVLLLDGFGEWDLSWFSISVSELFHHI